MLERRRRLSLVSMQDLDHQSRSNRHHRILHLVLVLISVFLWHSYLSSYSPPVTIWTGPLNFGAANGTLGRVRISPTVYGCLVDSRKVKMFGAKYGGYRKAY